MTPSTISEVALYVDDLQRATGFYQKLFGFPLVRGDERLTAFRIGPEQVLLLFLRGASSQPVGLPFGFVPAHGGAGSLHVCFAMAAADVIGWEERLRMFEIEVETRIVWPGGAVSLYFRDPDGNSVELATPGIWS